MLALAKEMAPLPLLNVNLLTLLYVLWRHVLFRKDFLDARNKLWKSSARNAVSSNGISILSDAKKDWPTDCRRNVTSTSKSDIYI
jgi:hypothetical protein